MVQRAIPPPSPYLYNPGSKGAVKERTKHKMALFSCKSAPLETEARTRPQNAKNKRKRRGENHQDAKKQQQQQQQTKIDELGTKKKEGELVVEVEAHGREEGVLNNHDSRALASPHEAITMRPEVRLEPEKREREEVKADLERLEIRTPTHVTFRENEEVGVRKEGQEEEVEGKEDGDGDGKRKQDEERKEHEEDKDESTKFSDNDGNEPENEVSIIS